MDTRLFCHDRYESACWEFFITALLNTFASALSWREAAVHHATHAAEAGRLEREQIESALYFVAHAVFLIGATLYLPQVNDSNYRSDVAWGTHTFLTGSCLFAAGAFVNGLGLFMKGRMADSSADDLYACGSLFATTIGCYCFVAGTMFYYPELEPEVEVTLGPSHQEVAASHCKTVSDWKLGQVGLPM